MSAVNPVEDERILTEKFLGELGMQPMGVAEPVPADRFEHFKDILPNIVLMAWQRFGFEGFNDGRFWITDPFAWDPVIEHWLGDLESELPIWDKWWCLTRTAFGGMQLWGEKTGTSIIIDPMFGSIYPDTRSAQNWSDPEQFQRMGRLLFARPLNDTAHEFIFMTLEATTQRIALMEYGLETLGPVGPNEVYGFTPALALGGQMTPETMAIEPAVAHLQVLAAIQRIRRGDLGQLPPLVYESFLPSEFRTPPQKPSA